MYFLCLSNQSGSYILHKYVCLCQNDFKKYPGTNFMAYIINTCVFQILLPPNWFTKMYLRTNCLAGIISPLLLQFFHTYTFLIHVSVEVYRQNFFRIYFESPSSISTFRNALYVYSSYRVVHHQCILYPRKPSL